MEDSKNIEIKALTPREMINEKSRRRRHEGSQKSSHQNVPSYEELSKSFFEPYPIPALGGQEGLTATDIAKLLRVQSGKLLLKVKKGKTAEMLNLAKLKMIPFGIKNENGMLYEEIAFETKAAELVIAKYENPIGWMYLRFLQASRDAFLVSLEKLKDSANEIYDLKQENTQLKKRLSKKGPYDPLCNVVIGSTEKDSILYGQSKVAETIQKKKSDLSEGELLLHDIQTSIRRGLGFFNRAFRSFKKIKNDCEKEEKGFEDCLQTANELDEIINKTSLDRDITLRSEQKLLKGSYLQPSLLDDDNLQPKYLN